MNNKLLIGAVGGSERFNNIVRDLKEVMEKYNLQFTPTILRDLIEEVERNIKKEDNQKKFSYDYPEIEKSKIIVTNDDKYFSKLIEENGAIPLFSPRYVEDIKGVEPGFGYQVYMVHIPLEK